jgi:His-Xaa-Ser system protein HxsD
MRTVDVEFDANAYSVDAVERALYRFSDRCAADVRVFDTTIRCTLTLRSADVDEDDLVYELRTEVLDQVLRERIRRETEPTRNLILSIAFSQTDFVGN